MATQPVGRQLTEPQCSLCGARGGRAVLTFADGACLVGCQECGLVYAWPHEMGDASALYGAEYYTHQQPHWQPGRGSWPRGLVLHRYYGYPLEAGVAERLPPPLRDVLATLAWPLKNRWRTIPPFVPGGSLLDVGCGSGAYLARVRSLGWRVHGIEPDREACRMAREGLLLHVQCGTLQEHVGAELYDVITFWHSLEHTQDPLHELRCAWRLLRPAGLVMIEVPNWASVQRWLFGPRWFHLDWPRHRLHFSGGNLRRALRDTGFIDITIRSVPSSLGVTGSLEKIVLGHSGPASGWTLRHNSALKAVVWPLEALASLVGWGGCIAATARKP